MKEVIELNKKKPKKVLVNVYTNFCNSCKIQTKTTFVDTSVANYLNKNFYLVNFDAESTDTVYFQNEKFYKQVVNGYPFNTFAFKITAGRFSLPSISILDEKLNVIDVLQTYQHPLTLKPILIFFGGNYYQTKKWPDFLAEYNNPKATKTK